MSGATIILAVALGVALLAVIILAAVLPRRVAGLIAAESTRLERRANIAQAALYAASATEVEAIVAPLRALLDDQSRQVFAAREHTAALATAEVERITAALRGLVERLATFAAAQYEQAAAAQTAPETTRKPNRPPAIAPPGSAEPLPPGPAQLAAGLRRPRASPQSGTSAIGGGDRRRATMLGLAPPAGPRAPVPSAPTLLSMPAATPATARPAPAVIVGGDHDPNGGNAA